MNIGMKVTDKEKASTELKITNSKYENILRKIDENGKINHAEIG